MCIARVGRIVNVNSGKATISYLDDHEITEVDVSTVNAKKGSYVEVFANVAIGRVTKRDAEKRQSLRLELLKRAKSADP